MVSRKWVDWGMLWLLLSHVWLHDPMDCSPTGSTLHRILQARTLERVAISFSRGSSQPRDWTHVSCISCIVRCLLYHWATWEAPDWGIPLEHSQSRNILCHTLPLFFISWRLITLQYCSGFCHTLTWISHGFTCIPQPDPPYHFPLYPILKNMEPFTNLHVILAQGPC